MATDRMLTTVNVEDKSVSFEFPEVGQVVVMLGELNSDISLRCTLHGLKQKLADSAALGKDATFEEKYFAIKETAERLVGAEGLWNKAGKGTCSKGGLLFRALTQLYADKSAEQLRAYLAGKTLSEQATLRAVPKIAEVIEELKLADAGPEDGGKSEELLGELDGLE